MSLTGSPSPGSGFQGGALAEDPQPAAGPPFGLELEPGDPGVFHVEIGIDAGGDEQAVDQVVDPVEKAVQPDKNLLPTYRTPTSPLRLVSGLGGPAWR